MATELIGTLELNSRTTMGLCSKKAAIMFSTIVLLGFCLLNYSVYVGGPRNLKYSILTGGPANIIPWPPPEATCSVPAGGFKGWNQGVVTALQPQGVKRNCSRLFSGDKLEVERVKNATAKWKSSLSYKELLERTQNCSWMNEHFSDNLYNSGLEIGFPIAFSLIVYDNPEQMLRLIKLLYRPQNTFCIHPDKKSKFRPFFENLAGCFSNIIIATQIVDVYWGRPSLLQAQVNCLSDLLTIGRKWKYVINLCGKELPLNTNRQMVEKLTVLNGTSSIYGWVVPKTQSWTMNRLKGKTLPYNLTYYKSMTFNALSYPFVEFLLRNSTALSLLDFFMTTGFPEEHYYATMFRIPGAPGGFNPKIPEYFEIDHYFWRTTTREKKMPCFGRTVHSICIVSSGDLPRIMEETKNGTTALFQNKYSFTSDSVVMDCAEERLVNINKREYDLDCPKTTTQS